MSRIARWQSLACAALLLCRSAFAEPTSAAREHFAQGVEQARLGDLGSAATNFEEAYRLSPHYAVQYNLGQAYVGLGRPVEAVRAFESYLEGGGRKLSPQRQDEVRQLILSSKKRIGSVALAIDPPEAQLFIDGRAVAVPSPGVPIQLSVGVHGVALTLPGYRAFVGSVKVEPQKAVPLEARLERTPAQSSLERIAVGQVAVDSALPELTISLDGASLDAVSKDPFLVPVGSHRIRCARAGYEPVDVRIEARERDVQRVDCNLTPLLAPPSATGLANFEVDPPDAEISIDGRRASHSARLPRGLHAVLVRRWGFVDWTQNITTRPGFPETLVVELKPTPEHASELAHATRKRRTLAYAVGGAGLALLGTSAVLYATNGQRYSKWAAANGDGSPPDVHTAISIQRQDDAALAIAVAGGMMLGYAVISWLGAK